ncbi:Aldo/keto reductase [Nadsonia fulvescens var. elongata DSM 6958]|uniref:Aldo/keto reductase n=1 Tax=Nadsonia fulvescens var. elongata DSM 6958 TaxID=857566 RepID=A0A1E3PMK5_9ASCO|nr:Aldo/keto reductase [Nadsonia fulvescens var. elongata DSM 6958]
MSSFTLSSGYEMPQVGFGAWKVNNDTCAQTIYDAIAAGYRLIDGAQDYGNEKECGQGLARAIADGIVTRDQIFITTKVWNSFHQYYHALASVERSLRDWGLDYFDLVLIHFPIALKYVDPIDRYPPGLLYNEESKTMALEPVPLAETWSALEKLVNDKKVRSIGVSNFNGGLLQDIYNTAKIKPSVLQIEHHPYLTQPIIISLCKKLNIQITAYSTFGPQSFVELDHPKVKQCVRLLEHDLIKTVADKHQKSPAQVILRWATQRGIAVIPKSNNKDRLTSNLKSTDFDLSDNELKQISDLDIGLRFNDPIDWPSETPLAIFH